MITEFYQIPTVEAVLAKLDISMKDLPEVQQLTFKQKVRGILKNAFTHLGDLYKSSTDKLSFIAAEVKSDVEQLRVGYQPFQISVDTTISQLDQSSKEIELRFPNKERLQNCLDAELSEYERMRGVGEKTAELFACVTIDQGHLGSGVDGLVQLNDVLKGLVTPPLTIQKSLSSVLTHCALKPTEKTPECSIASVNQPQSPIVEQQSEFIYVSNEGTICSQKEYLYATAAANDPSPVSILGINLFADEEVKLQCAQRELKYRCSVASPNGECEEIPNTLSATALGQIIKDKTKIRFKKK